MCSRLSTPDYNFVFIWRFHKDFLTLSLQTADAEARSWALRAGAKKNGGMLSK